MFALIAIVLLLVLGFWIVGNLIGLLLMLLMAAAVGWLADMIVPGEVPYGLPGLIAVGLVGGWIGVLLFGHMGPHILGIQVVPAFLGALILAFVIQVVAGRRSRAY